MYTMDYKKHFMKVAKDSTLEQYHDDIDVILSDDYIAISIGDWNLYIEFDDIEAYVGAIEYAIENHSRDLNLSYKKNPGPYDVGNSIDEIMLDI